MRRILKRVVTHLVATSIMLGLGIGLLIWNLAEHHYLSFSGVLVFIVLGSLAGCLLIAQAAWRRMSRTLEAIQLSNGFEQLGSKNVS
jgi:F0F1-type ATP synthase assembly protein I